MKHHRHDTVKTWQPGSNPDMFNENRPLWCRVKEFTKKKEKTAGASFSLSNHRSTSASLKMMCCCIYNVLKRGNKHCFLVFRENMWSQLPWWCPQILLPSSEFVQSGNTQEQSQRTFLWEDKLNHTEGMNVITYRLNNGMWCRYSEHHVAPETKKLIEKS